ncbi:MAG TPA: glycosyltransferase family 39 protein [Candidatus Woesebacteria bacterium]|nr:glycosyltransferase family 39 protein [Candidatus Woesebacteria bacterium]
MKKNIILNLTLLLIFIISILVNYSIQKNNFPNTDTNQNDLFSNLLISNKSYKYINNLNLKYSPPIFGIRGLLFFKDGFVPSSLPGMIFLVALFKLVSPKLLFLLNPLFSVLCLIYVHKIINKYVFSDHIISTLCIVIIYLSGPFLYVSNTPFKDLPSTTFFIIGLFFLLEAIYKDKKIPYFLFGLFAGISMWFNYPSVLFYLPFILLLLWDPQKGCLKKIKIKNIIIASIPFSFLFILLYFFQTKTYNGFLNFNNPIYNLNHYQLSSSSNGILSFIFKINIKNFITNIINQVFFVNPILVSLSIISILKIFLKKLNKSVDIILKYLFYIVILQCLFFVGKNWSGSGFVGSVGTSFSRYLLISWIIIVVIGVYYLHNILKTKIIFYISIFILLVTNIYQAFLSDMSIKYFLDTSKWTNTFQTQILKKTENNAIIFTNMYDKYIYPVRQTAIYVSIPETTRTQTSITLINELLKDNIPVYIMKEKDSESILYNIQMNDYGLKYKKITDNLLKIETK